MRQAVLIGETRFNQPFVRLEALAWLVLTTLARFARGPASDRLLGPLRTGYKNWRSTALSSALSTVWSLRVPPLETLHSLPTIEWYFTPTRPANLSKQCICHLSGINSIKTEPG